jgi:hypothetical protein
MNAELETTAYCPSCRAHLRIRVKNPEAGPTRTSCPKCYRFFNFTIPLSGLLAFDREQAEARRSKVSNLHGVNL